MDSTGTISHRVILIRIPHLYRPGMNATELYEATRGVWRLFESCWLTHDPRG